MLLNNGNMMVVTFVVLTRRSNGLDFEIVCGNELKNKCIFYFLYEVMICWKSNFKYRAAFECFFLQKWNAKLAVIRYSKIICVVTKFSTLLLQYFMGSWEAVIFWEVFAFLEDGCDIFSINCTIKGFWVLSGLSDVSGRLLGF